MKVSYKKQFIYVLASFLIETAKFTDTNTILPKIFVATVPKKCQLPSTSIFYIKNIRNHRFMEIEEFTVRDDEFLRVHSMTREQQTV